jgi:hypothetical protein
MLATLKDLLHSDAALAAHVWQELFPQLWLLLPTATRAQLGVKLTRVLQQVRA